MSRVLIKIFMSYFQYTYQKFRNAQEKNMYKFSRRSQKLIGLKSIHFSTSISKVFFKSRYRPQILEMETKLKPFLPDFIPAVGDPDAFMKIDRPDEKVEFLGLTVIDEPSVCFLLISILS